VPFAEQWLELERYWEHQRQRPLQVQQQQEYQEHQQLHQQRYPVLDQERRWWRPQVGNQNLEKRYLRKDLIVQNLNEIAKV
jgi:hypothetical protein